MTSLWRTDQITWNLIWKRKRRLCELIKFLLASRCLCEICWCFGVRSFRGGGSERRIISNPSSFHSNSPIKFIGGSVLNWFQIPQIYRPTAGESAVTSSFGGCGSEGHSKFVFYRREKDLWKWMKWLACSYVRRNRLSLKAIQKYLLWAKRLQLSANSRGPHTAPLSSVDDVSSFRFCWF